MSTIRIAGLALVAGLVGPGSASAEPLELKFRLVVKTYGVAVTELASLPGRTVGSGPATGVAVFEDGRIAYKDFVITTDGTAETGNYQGYSTYTFENGDSLTLKFTGGWSAEGSGGDYEVLSGTGAFEGTSGTGRFDQIDAPWEGAELHEGSFSLEVPGS